MHCHVHSCSLPASVFHFEGSLQACSCTEHAPSQSATYPLSLINLVRSPQDAPLHLSRSQEVSRGKSLLSAQLSSLRAQLETALSDLSASRTSAHKSIDDMYDSEVRRTKQHFHQIEAAIAKIDQKLDHYLKVKEYSLPELAKKLVADGVSFPVVKHCKVWDNSIELAEAVRKSVYRRGVYWEKDVVMMLSTEEKE